MDRPTLIQRCKDASKKLLFYFVSLYLFLPGQHGIILSVQEWRKLANAIRYIDKKIEIVAKRMEESNAHKK